MTGKRFLLFLSGLVVLLASAGVYAVAHPDRARGSAAPVQSITVSGTGTVTTTP